MRGSKRITGVVYKGVLEVHWRGYESQTAWPGSLGSACPVKSDQEHHPHYYECRPDEPAVQINIHEVATR